MNNKRVPKALQALGVTDHAVTAIGVPINDPGPTGEVLPPAFRAPASEYKPPTNTGVMQVGAGTLGSADDTEEEFDVDPDAPLPIQSVPAVYQWTIPGPANDYTLTVRVNTYNIEEARGLALSTEITSGDTVRELTLSERAWITAYDPLIVADTLLVTMDHERCLHDNRRLRAENGALQATKKLFQAWEIDPDNPAAWVESIKATAAAAVEMGKREQDGRRATLAVTLKKCMALLSDATDATGHADPKPVPPPEPDYSKVTVVVADVKMAPFEFPRLAQANFAAVSPSEPLTETEEWALARILNDNNGLVPEWMRRGASETEYAAMQAGLARIKGWMQGAK